MKPLLLFLLLATPAADYCRAQEFRCRLRCEEDTKGATMERLRCYERCESNAAFCRKYGDNQP